jgi:predicted regulator of Ras-like GTPase activity (Roadblock/LC7/MglB family)
MNEDPYAVALKNALTEIKNICPDVSRSFIFNNDGAIVADSSETDQKTMEKMIHSFQSVAEKADTIGSLKALHVNGKKGKLILSNVNDLYLALVASENATQSFYTL